MKNYKLINGWSVKQELENLKNSCNFIPDDELKKMKLALELKKYLEDNGFYTAHFKKEKKFDDSQVDVAYVFNAKKSNFELGDSSQTFYGAIFSIYNWLLRSNEVEKYEFI